MKTPKPKKCKFSGCGKKFQPWSSTQQTCHNSTCAFGYDREKKAKKEARKLLLDRKEFRLSDKPLQKKLTQALVNKFVRLRDAGKPCISCGTYTGQMQAGHYFSVGSSEHLRFAIKNIFLQCATCNNHLSGNLINFRLGLVERYGEQFVIDLEADKAPRKFNNEQVIQIGKYYNGMVKALTESA